MQTFTIKYKDASRHNAAIFGIKANSAADALLIGAKALGFDTDPLTQTYSLALEAIAQTQTRELTYYSDPAHGWLAVLRSDLAALNIADQITPYSYQCGLFVFLEEDCDMAAYIRASTAAGWDIKLKEVYQENTPIRNFEPYRKATQ